MRRYWKISEAAKELFLSHQGVRDYAKAFGFYLKKRPGAHMRLDAKEFDQIKKAIELRREGMHTMKGAVHFVKTNESSASDSYSR